MASTIDTGAVEVGRRWSGAEPPARLRRKRILIGIAEHSVLIVLAIMFLAPFVFMVLTGLMTNQQSLTTNLWPQPFDFHNIVEVFKEAPMLRYALNTFEYAALATLGLVISSVPVAYALACLQWRGRNLVFVGVLVSMMLPPQVTVIPIYVLFAHMHLVGTIWPLVIPNWFGTRSRPSLASVLHDDSTRVRRRCEGRRLRRVPDHVQRRSAAGEAGDRRGGAVQLPALLERFLGTAAVRGPEPRALDAIRWPLPVRNIHEVNWNLVMAGSVVFMAPVIVLFFFAQKAFVEGITLTGVKG